MRKRGQVDANQSAMVADLRKIGATVMFTSSLGSGFGDIVGGYNGLNFCFEIKDPDKVPSKRVLTPDEKKFHEEWAGQIDIILTLEDALKIMTGARQ